MRRAPLLGLVLASCAEQGRELGPEDTAGPQGDTATAHEQTWHRDADGDGFGDPDTVEVAEEASSGFVAEGTDCDDSDSAVFPGAPETCNARDDDCDGQVDEGLTFATWYLDRDGDGFGDDAETMETCEEPAGYAAVGGDCEDDDPTVHPGAEEVCESGVDDDCDGEDPRCRLEGTISLSEAPVKYLGGTAGDLAGYQLACGGDTNGDGNSEILIGESEQFTDDFTGGDQIGGAWLVSGVAPGTHLLDTAAEALWGDAASTFFDGAKSFLPDLDGDGFDEVLMGSTAAQAAYLFRGPMTGPRVPADADAVITKPGDGLSLGWRATAVGPGTSTFAVSGVGNLYQDGTWGRMVGEVYVFDGPLDGEVTTDVAVASLSPSVYHQYGYFGWSVCSGDLDGDGTADMAVGAPSPYPTSSYPDYMTWGVAYVTYGPLSGELRMADAEGSLLDADARIQGSSTSGGYLGQAMSCSGDTDGDGRADLLLTSGGGAYRFASAPTGVMEEVDADGMFLGTVADVLVEADLDGDGHEDALVGVPGDEERGAVYVFYSPISGTVGSPDADAVLVGEAAGDLAYALAGCGDLDGDGVDDVLVGAAGESTNGTWSGAAYLLFGGSGDGP